MKIARAIKAKKLRQSDLLIVWTEGFPPSVVALADVNHDAGWGSTIRTGVTFKHEAGSMDFAPDERVMVFR